MDMKDILTNVPTKEDIADILAKMKDLTGTLPSKDDLARALGLKSRGGFGDGVLLPLTLLGAGIFVGAAVALLLAPKTGRDLRQDLGARASELRDACMGSERDDSLSSHVPVS